MRPISLVSCSSVQRIFGPRLADWRGEACKRHCSLEGRPQQAHAFSTRRTPVAVSRGDEPDTAHLFDLHPRLGLSPSLRRIRSRSSSFSIARPAMTRFLRRPCSSIKSSCWILSSSSPAGRKASRHWRQDRRPHAVLATSRLQIGSAGQLHHHAQLARGRASGPFRRGRPRVPKSAPSGLLPRAKNPSVSCWTL